MCSGWVRVGKVEDERGSLACRLDERVKEGGDE